MAGFQGGSREDARDSRRRVRKYVGQERVIGVVKTRKQSSSAILAKGGFVEQVEWKEVEMVCLCCEPDNRPCSKGANLGSNWNWALA